MYNPNVDLLRADWSPFQQTEWLMPLLTDLSEWRQKMLDIEEDIRLNHNDTDLMFLADFPGEQTWMKL